jgi:hypothetical protein
LQVGGHDRFELVRHNADLSSPPCKATDVPRAPRAKANIDRRRVRAHKRVEARKRIPPLTSFVADSLPARDIPSRE